MMMYEELMQSATEGHALMDDMSAWAQTVKGIAAASQDVRNPHHGSSIEDFMAEQGIDSLWDSRKLGAEDRFVRVADASCERAVKAALGIGDINSTAKGSAARYNAGKAQVQLIPVWIIAAGYRARLESDLYPSDDQYDALETLERLGDWQQYPDHTAHLHHAMAELGDSWDECAAVFAYGATKYPAHNWCKGMPWSAVLASATRHLLQMLRGETHDQESGLTHRGHVYCNLVMLMHYSHTYPEGNDIPEQFLGDLDPMDAPWQGDFS